MATVAQPSFKKRPSRPRCPRSERNRLTRTESERRYDAMPA